VNPGQIERLLAGLPAAVDTRQRRRINGYAAAVRRCDERIAVRHTELARALRYLDEAAAAGSAVDPADEAIRLALELEALERIQPRIDSWLRVAIAAVTDNPGSAPFGEGPA
jgi:hypothetical protein